MRSDQRSSGESRRRFLKQTASCFAVAGLGGLSARPAPDAVTPARVIRPFEGDGLGQMYTWLRDTGYEDPTGVFSMKDGVLRALGMPMGYAATRQAYKDFHLVVEFKWGEKTYGSKTVRNSGVLLHATGPDGNRNPWMASLECQLAQGCVGDFIAIRGKDSGGEVIPVDLTSDTIVGEDGRTRWKKGGTPTRYSGKQFWWSQHDPEFEELIDTSGRWDVESPLGEWTRVECICDGDKVGILVNGVKVNEAYNVFPAAGKILLQSEGFEIFFRNLELRPL